MVREYGKLSARKVETLKVPGRHLDGGNLYLSISDNGGKRWVFFYRFNGKRKEMGLGSAARGSVSLLDARKEAANARALILGGVDPLDAKEARKQAERTVPTFGAFADDYISTHKSKFRNPKHVAQWEMTLKTYCQPIRALRLNEIDTEAVLKVLQPIWKKVPETASRVRGSIENILDAGKAKGYRSGENPATWRGHLKTLLPARQKLKRGHHAALATLLTLSDEKCVAKRNKSPALIKFPVLKKVEFPETIWPVGIPAQEMSCSSDNPTNLSP